MKIRRRQFVRLAAGAVALPAAIVSGDRLSPMWRHLTNANSLGTA
jgi:hypothetical protein